MSLDFKFSAERVIQQGRTTKKNLHNIQQWLALQSEKFIPHNIPDELIVLFLLCSENNLDLAKNEITSYYKLRLEAPEMFNGRDMNKEDVLLTLKTMSMIFIPTRTDKNDVVIIIKLNDSDYTHFNVIPKIRLCLMLMDLAYHGDPPNGLLILVDMEMFGFKHISRIKIDALKVFFTYGQEGLPLKLTSFHFVNSGLVLRTFWSMVKVFIKEDVLAKFFLHDPDATQEKLFRYIPKHCLPVNYGGELPDITILQDMTVERLKANQEFWDNEEASRKFS